MVKFKNAIIRRLQEIAKVTVLRLSQPEVIYYLFIYLFLFDCINFILIL